MHISYTKEVTHSGLGKAGLVLLALFLLMAGVCPFFTRDPALETEEALRPPSFEHLLGTNEVGQDVLARLAGGARTSILMAVSVGVLSTALSALIGVSAALTGGVYDRAAMRFADAFLAIPALIVLILLAAFVQPALWGLALLISILHWPGAARVLRAQTLSVKERSHVLVSRTFGAGRLHVPLRHVLPELGPLLVVSFIQRARTAVDGA